MWNVTLDCPLGRKEKKFVILTLFVSCKLYNLVLLKKHFLQMNHLEKYDLDCLKYVRSIGVLIELRCTKSFDFVPSTLERAQI
jgi:hypothetical protein